MQDERMDSARYRSCLEAERLAYRNCDDVHDLPPIFHYWSRKFLEPQLRACGYDDLTDLFAQHLAARCSPGARFASLGAGNCDFEIELTLRLQGAGYRSFTFDCVDMNPDMLQRGLDSAQAAGVRDAIAFVESDFNSWAPAASYRAVLANQSLHHVLNLEGLLGEVQGCLADDGVFLVSDMIGRNGHLRWPEACAILDRLWKQLPPSRCVNRIDGVYQSNFENRDFSDETFEGIRAQDILPLLDSHFCFHFFFPFGNLIDVFVDRMFGPNFDPGDEDDRAFIDAVHALDEEGLRTGQLTPTHLIAVLGKHSSPAPVYRENLRPEQCFRNSGSEPRAWQGAFPSVAFRRSSTEELRRFADLMAEGREIVRQRLG